MSYSIYLISKDKPITQDDLDTALENLSPHNKGQIDRWGFMICDVDRAKEGMFLRLSGSFKGTGKYAEGFALNLLTNLISLGYAPRVWSEDFGYGTKEDGQWIDDNC